MPRINHYDIAGKIVDEKRRLNESLITKCRFEHITQREIAEAQGISYGAISQQFRNKKLSVDTICTIKIILGEKAKK